MIGTFGLLTLYDWQCLLLVHTRYHDRAPQYEADHDGRDDGEGMLGKDGDSLVTSSLFLLVQPVLVRQRLRSFTPKLEGGPLKTNRGNLEPETMEDILKLSGV